MARYMWEPRGGSGSLIKERRSPSAISRIRSHPYKYTNATRHGEFREAWSASGRPSPPLPVVPCEKFCEGRALRERLPHVRAVDALMRGEGFEPRSRRRRSLIQIPLHSRAVDALMRGEGFELTDHGKAFRASVASLRTARRTGSGLRLPCLRSRRSRRLYRNGSQVRRRFRPRLT